jgi:hypothetical protein
MNDHVNFKDPLCDTCALFRQAARRERLLKYALTNVQEVLEECLNDPEISNEDKERAEFELDLLETKEMLSNLAANGPIDFRVTELD